MKSGIVAGAIAGLVSGIVSSISVSVGLSIGLYGGGFWGIPAAFLPADLAIAMVVLTFFFGTILGLLYSKFYDLIPGSGLRKGLNFGLMVGFVKDIMADAYVTIPMMQPIIIGVNLIVGGFYMWIIYGLVIGALYKK